MKGQKAFGYVRVSGRGQIDGDGFTRQRAAIGRYAAAHGIEVVRVFEDGGVSGGTDLAHREGLAALIDAVESNGVRLVLCERGDRLARELMVGEIILQQFRAAGVTVIEVEGGNELTGDGDDPTRNLVRQVLMAIAEFDKAVTVLKLRAARDRIRSRTGRCEGRKGFGFRPGEQATVERMRELRRKPRLGKRLSFAGIAALLNAEGRPTRTGKPWVAETVRGILTRPPQNPPS